MSVFNPAWLIHTLSSLCDAQTHIPVLLFKVSVIHDLPETNFVHHDQIQNDMARRPIDPVASNQVNQASFIGGMGQGNIAAISNTAGAGQLLSELNSIHWWHGPGNIAAISNTAGAGQLLH